MRFAPLTTLVYFVVNLTTVLLHEPWRDEAQAWLTARDLGVFGIVEHMGYGGSPALWHLSLVPLTAMGLPILSQQLLHLAFATGTVWLLTSRSNLSRPLLILLISGYFLGFEYVIVSRSYALGILLTFAAVAFDERRHEAPWRYGILIALLANTSAHFLMLAAVLGLAFLVDVIREKRWTGPHIGAMTLMGVAGIAAMVQSLPADDFVLQGYETNWRSPLDAINGALFPMPALSSGFMVGLASVLWLVVLAHIWVQSRRAALILIGTMAGFSYVFAFGHSGALRHHGLILVVTIAALWLAGSAQRHSTTGSPQPGSGSCGSDGPAVFGIALSSLAQFALCAPLLVSLDFSYNMHRGDHLHEFSGARAVADYLRSNPVQGPIAAHDSALSIGVLPHLPAREFWQVDRGEFGTFGTFDVAYDDNRRQPATWMLQTVVDEFGWTDRPHLLLNYTLHDAGAWGYRGLFANTDPLIGAMDERLFLYGPIPGAPPPDGLRVPDASRVAP